jgi:hypothetical protein
MGRYVTYLSTNYCQQSARVLLEGTRVLNDFAAFGRLFSLLWDEEPTTFAYTGFKREMLHTDF